MATEMLRVESTLISAIGHDAENKVLHVEFKDGAKWEYAEVDAETFDRMRNAESVGKFFHAEIKPHHTGTRAAQAPAEDTQ